MPSSTNIKIAIVSLGALLAISSCTEPLDQTYLIGTSRPGTGFSVFVLRCTPNGKADYIVRGKEAAPVERV